MIILIKKIYNTLYLTTILGKIKVFPRIVVLGILSHSTHPGFLTIFKYSS